MIKIIPHFSSVIILLLLLPLLSFPQTKFHVTGQVRDDSGKPIAGATISVKGASVATTTGEDGTFSFDVPSGKSIL
jgi:hypothetical protein